MMPVRTLYILVVFKSAASTTITRMVHIGTRRVLSSDTSVPLSSTASEPSKKPVSMWDAVHRRDVLGGIIHNYHPSSYQAA